MNLCKVCYICKGKFGLKVYKRIMVNGGKQKEVDVCSRRCRNKKLREWGNGKNSIQVS